MLIKLKLGPNNPFFFLGPIMLTPESPVSDPIDMDNIPEQMKKTIEGALRLRDVKTIEEDVDLPIEVRGEDKVSLEDEDQISSATVNEPEPEPKPDYDEEDVKSAKVFLGKNGNVVRAAIKKISVSPDSIPLVLACIHVETMNKKREGVLSGLQNVLEKINALG